LIILQAAFIVGGVLVRSLYLMQSADISYQVYKSKNDDSQKFLSLGNKLKSEIPEYCSKFSEFPEKYISKINEFNRLTYVIMASVTAGLNMVLLIAAKISLCYFHIRKPRRMIIAA